MPTTTTLAAARDRGDLGGAGPVAAYLALCLIWGSTFLGIRLAVETIPPWTMIGGRSVLAGFVLVAVSSFWRRPVVSRAQLLSACLSGVLLFTGGQALLAWGETRLPSGQAAILGCTVSLFTPIVSWLIGASRRPGIFASFGLALGFCGVVVLAGTGQVAPDGLACAAVLLSSVSWAFGAAVARRWAPAGSALLGSGLQMLAGGAACLLLGGMRGEWDGLAFDTISARSLAGFFYLVVMGSLVGFACFGWLVQVWRPERLSTYAYVNPVVALAIGAGLAGEAVGAREVAAVALILGAVALVMVGGARRRT
jgi:drug/metabolite transporter (DMT)-like permease